MAGDRKPPNAAADKAAIVRGFSSKREGMLDILPIGSLSGA
jgi:hypothetical protein